ncbi:Putative two-component system sensor kinase [Mycobacteroides abscessus subsp. bolletii]|nr:Putative two-component system sensor kinase [Mycobacteroides abscessus subsp. bolletii]
MAIFEVAGRIWVPEVRKFPDVTPTISTLPLGRSRVAGDAVGDDHRASSPRLRGWLTLPFRPGAPPSATLGILVAAGFLVCETVAALLLRQIAPTERMGTIYLLGILVVSAIWGLRLAVLTSIASAITFDYVRDWPNGHVLSVELQNGVVHVIFLVAALVANGLASLARARTNEVEARRREAAVIAEQQAGLRRIATLVAREVPPAEVFAALVDEMVHCLHADTAVLLRYEAGNNVTIVAASGEVGLGHVPGTQLTLDDDVPPEEALGFGASLSTPIRVGGNTWGAAVLWGDGLEVAPVNDFADLAATAIANAHTREELTASRARIVTAADEARRRLERDLHDGVQQRLASLRLRLGMMTAELPVGVPDLASQLAELNAGLVGVAEDLQEFSRGVHPAILSSGLRPALCTLARRSAVPVTIEVNVDGAVGESVEMAAYYVLAEALANAAKHSAASGVRVSVRCEGPNLRMVIRDDGVGGANPRKGSGLVGLTDRVEALGGQLSVSSPVGRGTSLDISIPIR